MGEKDALLVASFDQLIQRIHDERPTATVAPDGSRTDRVAALFDPFVDLFTSDTSLARTYASVLVAGQHQSIVFTDLSRMLINEIEETLRDATRTESHQLAPLAESLYFAYIGRLFTWSPGGDDDAAELKQSLRRIVAAICSDEELAS
ncbi:MAG: hypothetical protein QM713_00300 [Arachnia sp.]